MNTINMTKGLGVTASATTGAIQIKGDEKIIIKAGYSLKIGDFEIKGPIVMSRSVEAGN